MKKSLFIPALLIMISACQNGGNATEEESSTAVETAVEEAPEAAMAYFGGEISEEGAVGVNDLSAQLEGKDSVDLKVVGLIDKVCQVKGCWMTMAYDDEMEMRVSFRDYGFFVPKDIDGKEAVIDGTLYMETTSVEDLKHYAEDEGLSEEEIATITEPETSLTFVADGVIVKDYNVKVGSAEEDEQNLEENEMEEDHTGHDH